MLKKAVLVGLVALVVLALPAIAQEGGNAPGSAPAGVRWGALSAAFVLGIAAAAGAIEEKKPVTVCSPEMFMKRRRDNERMRAKLLIVSITKKSGASHHTAPRKCLS